MKRLTATILLGVMVFGLLTGCTESTDKADNGNDTENSIEDGTNGTNDTSDANDTNNTDSSGDDNNIVEADFSLTDDDMFSERDYETDYDEKDSIYIELKGDSATASDDSVKISGTTITITKNTTHIISGTLDDGMIIVDAEDTAKLQLVFNGVNINSETSAALYIIEADKVFVTLADGTDNTLSNGGTFEAVDDNNIDATVFSKQDLTLNGSGTLTVTSPAGHGIVAKDDLVITSGTYIVESASHGVDANDSVRITGDVSLTIDAGKDGIHAENNDDTSLGFVYISGGVLDIEAEGDGIDAGAYLQIEDGTMTLLAGGGSENGSSASSNSFGGYKGGNMPGMTNSNKTTDSDESSTSMKGMKAANSILIKDGNITIDSADDAIHSNISITINGGVFELASGDDAVHAEDTLTITACDMNVEESYEGLEAQEIYVSGGDMILNASDDGLNASGGNDASGTMGGRDGMFGGGGMMSSGNGNIEISGGNITIYASGDGLDSNGTLTISDGYIYVANPTAGDTSVIDSDVSPVINGGTFISTGSTTMMAQSFSSSSTQGVIACTTGTQQAGETVTVQDAEGNTVISYEVEYTCVLVIISSPDIVKGETYTVTVGSTSGSIEAN